jgi:hypothetical protein
MISSLPMILIPFFSIFTRTTYYSMDNLKLTYIEQKLDKIIRTIESWDPIIQKLGYLLNEQRETDKYRTPEQGGFPGFLGRF